jgi:hypothetical protein
MEAEHVWYASYGSNMDRERMMCYIQGGRPHGGARTYKGSSDRSVPLAQRPVTFDFPLYFAGESKVWGGGMAFLDQGRRSPAAAYGQAYLITKKQFEDVLAQENWREHKTRNLGGLTAGSERLLGEGNYDKLVCTGIYEGIPEITFTHPLTCSERETTPPTIAYLAMLASGLLQSHGLGTYAAAHYLADCAGASTFWTARDIAKKLREVTT